MRIYQILLQTMVVQYLLICTAKKVVALKFGSILLKVVATIGLVLLAIWIFPQAEKFGHSLMGFVSHQLELKILPLVNHAHF